MSIKAVINVDGGKIIQEVKRLKVRPMVGERIYMWATSGQFVATITSICHLQEPDGKFRLAIEAVTKVI